MSDRDEYRGPAGHAMTRRLEALDKDMIINGYATPAYQSWLLKSACTTGPERRIGRWGHEAVTDGLQERCNKAPEQMRLRWQTVEHPFGTLTAWMGATHFQTKTLDRGSTEISLHLLAYNFERTIFLECQQNIPQSSAD